MILKPEFHLTEAGISIVLLDAGTKLKSGIIVLFTRPRQALSETRALVSCSLHLSKKFFQCCYDTVYSSCGIILKVGWHEEAQGFESFSS